MESGANDATDQQTQNDWVNNPGEVCFITLYSSLISFHVLVHV